MSRSFRFGVQARGRSGSLPWAEVARRAEALGYSTLFVPDHADEQLGPFVAMATAAAVTSTLRVGVLVLDNDFRHPALVAKDIASLDQLSGGRVEVGLGAGWLQADYDQLGLRYDPAAERVERLSEAIAIVKELWTTGASSFRGRHYALAGAKGWPPPVTKPHPTLIVGGGSPMVLKLAAREADVVGVNVSLAAGSLPVGAGADASALVRSASPERFDRRVAWVRETAGARLDALELQVLTQLVEVGPEARRHRDELASLVGLSPAEAAEVPIVLFGDADEVADTLVERRERYGFSYWVVHQDEMDAFAPVVDRLSGQ